MVLYYIFTIVPIISFSAPTPSPDVKLYDYIKEEVGARMVDRIYDFTKEIKHAAELGTNRIGNSEATISYSQIFI